MTAKLKSDKRYPMIKHKFKPADIAYFVPLHCKVITLKHQPEQHETAFYTFKKCQNILSE